jgi:diacylglycerol kinase family enzyme
MYFYILDSTNISPAEFEKAQVTLQGLLTQFRISGEMVRVTSIRGIPELVELAAERGVKTLIASGTDDTFNIMLAYLAGRDFALGFIPLVPETSLGQILGIDSLETAVKTVAARRLEKLDLAVLGDNYFISQVEFGIASTKVKNMGWFSSMRTLGKDEIKVKLRIDNSYTMDITCLGGTVTNSRTTSSANNSIANPTDGFLDLMVLERLSRVDVLKYKPDIAAGVLENIPGTSVIKCRQVEFLEPRGFPLNIAGRTFAKVPAVISIIPRELRMIVGKGRTF